jgi:hypothetical protein
MVEVGLGLVVVCNVDVVVVCVVAFAVVVLGF